MVIRYDSTSGFLTLLEGEKIVHMGSVASLSFTKGKGPNDFSLRAVGKDGSVKTFGQGVPAEGEAAADQSLAEALAEYLRGPLLCDED